MRPARLRPLPLLWLLSALVPALATAPPARAALITGYAIGQITENLSTPGTSAYPFTVGEAVYLTFRYDLDLGPVPGPAPDLIELTIGTATGFGQRVGPLAVGGGGRSIGSESGNRLFLEVGEVGTGATLGFNGDVGSLLYSRDLGVPSEGFRASLVRVADDSAFPIPEPSALGLGLLGASLAGLYRWGRRAAA